MTMRYHAGLAAAVLFLGIGTPARAHIPLSATLDAAQEVPAPTGVSAAARGSARFALEEDGSISYEIEVEGLTGTVIAAHIHDGAPGVAGNVVVPFNPPLSGDNLQTTLTPAQIQTLISGGMYVNVHTAANPGGELRGQIGLAHGAAIAGRSSRRRSGSA